MTTQKKCLKCRLPFSTTRPRTNHICEPCTAENALLCQDGIPVEYTGCEEAVALLDAR